MAEFPVVDLSQPTVNVPFPVEITPVSGAGLDGTIIAVSVDDWAYEVDLLFVTKAGDSFELTGFTPGEAVSIVEAHSAGRENYDGVESDGTIYVGDLTMDLDDILLIRVESIYEAESE